MERRTLGMGVLAACLAMLLPASLASEERRNAISYKFPDVMLPDEASNGEVIIAKEEPWLTFKAAPYRLARMEGDFTAAYGDRTRQISKDEIIFISTGDDIYGCALYEDWSDAGEKVPCFADLDADGHFEMVIMKKTTPALNSYAGKVALDDFRSIDPLPYTMIAERDAIVAIRGEEEWHMEHNGRTIRICQSHLSKEYRFCLREKGKIRRSEGEQLVEYKEGEFLVRWLGNGSVAVRVKKLPEPITF